MNLVEIANQLKESDKKIILIYAFNAIGKTRLSVAYKNATKDLENGKHAGVYYNAFSEDLFVWDNDEEHDGKNIHLTIKESSLNQFHESLTEDAVREKLAPYNPKYTFSFSTYENIEKGIESVSFFVNSKETIPIKISRGEERIFVWCLFLAMFEAEGWADQQDSHIFIDDPVSSLDDHNIFVTATTIFDLIEQHFENRKIIFATHHLGIFSILSDWLSKGEKADKFKGKGEDKKPKAKYEQFTLNREGDDLVLKNTNQSVFLYHLRLLQLLEEANTTEELYVYHFALLRQILENVASFLGVGQFSYVLEQIGIKDKDRVANIINALSHKKVYYNQSYTMVPDNKAIFKTVFEGLKNTYNFVLHTGKK